MFQEIFADINKIFFLDWKLGMMLLYMKFRPWYFLISWDRKF